MAVKSNTELRLLKKKREGIEKQATWFEKYFTSVENFEKTKNIIIQLESDQIQNELPTAEINKRKYFETKINDLITTVKRFISSYYDELRIEDESNSVRSSVKSNSSNSTRNCSNADFYSEI